MNLSAFLYPFVLIGLFIIAISLSSVRISLVMDLKDDVLSYRISGSVLKYITVFALKSGDKQESKQLGKKGGKGKGEKYLNILKNALKEPELRLIVVERLVLEGTYSIGDAAVNAILFGILIILWQILIIYLSENYKLEHESFRFKPDFQSDRNNFKFHVTLRAAIYKIVWLILKHTIKTHRANGKEFNKTEYFYT